MVLIWWSLKNNLTLFFWGLNEVTAFILFVFFKHLGEINPITTAPNNILETLRQKLWYCVLSETLAAPSRILTRHLNPARNEEAGLPVEGTRKIWAQVPLHSLCIHMLVTFNVLMWLLVFFYRRLFTEMLSLDFLDDVRRMNKRQVGISLTWLWCYDRFFVWPGSSVLTQTSLNLSSLLESVSIALCRLAQHSILCTLSL